eukprot:Seg3511.6 transcript_id=Seg3511.6/GoldUCD/mRNA.D3Y31 product="NAD kinase" protein_id=Seg3511.6/GoldUCD/D3Y31
MNKMADAVNNDGATVNSNNESSSSVEKSKRSVKTKRGTSVYSKCLERRPGHPDCELLLGPPPAHRLGPKACILFERDFEDDDVRNEIFLKDPSTQFLHWKSEPRKVLIIKKINDFAVTEDFKKLAKWLIEDKEMTVYVESNVVEERVVKEDESFQETRQKLVVCGKDALWHCDIDLIACLGGDGTLLHASSLFQESCPPIISFHLGTLGFLMPFSFDNFHKAIDQTISENVGLTLRSRLKNQVIENKDTSDDDENVVLSEHLTLNEVVIDRGPAASLVNLEIICNGRPLTTLLGDGLIVATATGSTAYSAAAGASMVHPSVPCIILTPICPHSLSFRPIIVPAGVELKVKLSPNSRYTAWASFDGRSRVELTKSKFVRITTSVYPLPCISHADHLSDWFDSLAQCLQWNTRDNGRRRKQNMGNQ